MLVADGGLGFNNGFAFVKIKISYIFQSIIKRK